MRPDCRKHLEDVRLAAEAIGRFTAGRSREDYAADAILRSAVERQFEIVGEALNRLQKVDSALLARIGEHRKIIAFRNILIHGYDAIDHEIVWDAVQQKLPLLHQQVQTLLAEPVDQE